jgi:NADPH-dependent curcumin reductase CurA
LIFIDPTIQVKHWTKKTDWKFNQSTVEDDFQLIEEELSTTLHDGEALFETLFISIDKYTM